MTTRSEELITPALASEVAQALTTPETLDEFVARLPAESVPLYLARLVDAATNIRALTKGLEGRLVEDVVRLPNGNVLIELPLQLDHAATISVRVR